MTNKEIAYAFDELANLMELHEEDGFRIKSYRNAYLALRKVDQPLQAMSDAEMLGIKGVGKAIAEKIQSLLRTGKMPALEKYREMTPPGVVEMLEVNGFGPKKVRSVWQDMGIETVGELWYACNENRLIEFKGFGLKTQEDLKSKLNYFLRSRDQFHYDTAEEAADFALSRLQNALPEAKMEPVGQLRRRCSVVEKIEILIAWEGNLSLELEKAGFHVEKKADALFVTKIENETPIYLIQCSPERYYNQLFLLSGSPEFLSALNEGNTEIPFHFNDENEVFAHFQLPFIAPELRERPDTVAHARAGKLPKLIEDQDIKGILHVHTTWSDGLHDLETMCTYAKQMGYEYIGITDHSKSAFYANGLQADRILAQMEAIEALNEKLAPFKIWKGIESDILNDGSLDYPDELLEKFDFIIASVHSNLKMSAEKATARLLKAIQNPFTTILGHPTGRLLLSREGYPLDWNVILDACQEHQVALELNANPHRLDLDWTLIPEATRRGIPIAINPDAHSKNGYDDIRYGVMCARKGGLQAEQCVNHLSLIDFQDFINKKRIK